MSKAESFVCCICRKRPVAWKGAACGPCFREHEQTIRRLEQPKKSRRMRMRQFAESDFDAVPPEGED